MNPPITRSITRALLTFVFAAVITTLAPSPLHAQPVADVDADGISDAVDNCPRAWNPDQATLGGSAIGAACDGAFVGVVPVRPPKGEAKHPTFSGASLTLKAVATVGVNQYMWDFGDGSAPTAWTNIANPYNLGVNHVYNGAVDQEFTATIYARHSANPGTTYQAEFPIVLKADSLDLRSAMAVEQGLWYLHTNMVRGTYANGPPGNANPYGYWGGDVWYVMAGARAFAAQGHTLTSGNKLTDPYVETVTRAANYLMTAIVSSAVANQVHAGVVDKPDTNLNGYGLRTNTGSSAYHDGFFLDLLVHLGPPQWTAVTGAANTVSGRTLEAIAQDFIDYIAFWQADSGTYRGGWHYSANSNTADNSTSMYPATGLLAAREMQTFDLTIPAFVINENRFWTNYSQNQTNGTAQSGRFGYSHANDCYGPAWYECTVTTSSGILQLTLQGVPASDPRIQKALTYLGNYWGYAMSASVGGNAGMTSYAMYAALKALRHAEVTTLTRGATTFDWYNTESTFSGGQTYLGLRRRLVSRQAANGSWNDTAGNAAFAGTASTALAIIMLSEDDYIVFADATATDLSVTYDGNERAGTGTCVNSAPGSAGSYQLNGTAIAGLPTDAGTYTFVWTCPGDSGHLPSTDTGTITIARAPTTTSVVFGAAPYVYSGAAFTASATVSGGLVSLTPEVIYAGDCTNVTAAGCTATASFAGDANHLPSNGSASITILKADTTVAIDCSSGAPFTYSGAAITPCVATPSGAGTLTSAATLTYTDNVNAGTATVSAMYPGDDNHNASPEATATFAIARAAATVTAGSGTKVFGTADPVLTPSSSGFLPADGIIVSQDARDAGENAGTYATHASASGPGISNYAVQSIDGTLEITRATPVVTATGAVATYDGQPHGGTCSAAGVNGDVLGSDASYAPGAGAPVAAGAYTLTCSFAGNGNYEPAADTAAITIDRAAATVTAGSGLKVYGEIDPALTPSSSGFLVGDDITITQTARDAGENVGSYPTHAAAAGAALGNYAVTFVDGALTITAAPLTVKANDATRSFGVANPPFTVAITGFVAGDTAAVLGGTLSIVTTATELSPLGTYPIVPSGLTSTNYAIAFVNGTLTINNTAPSCSAAAPSVTTIWEPNQQWVPITLTGVTDAEGDALTINVDSIFQDEAVNAAGSGNTATDGAGVGTNTAQVRASRAGTGDGRVYHVTFTVTDIAGASCTTTVKVSVPHSQNGAAAGDGGPLFDSTIPVVKK